MIAKKNQIHQKEDNSMRKMLDVITCTIASAAFVAVLATGANASTMVGFDPTGTASYSYSDVWTNFTDTGFVQHFDPLKSIPPDPSYQTQYSYQGRVSGMQSNGVPSTPLGLNFLGAGGFELTWEASLWERVTGQTLTGSTLKTDFKTPTGPQLASSTISLYIDKFTSPANALLTRANPGSTSPTGATLGTVTGYGDDDGIGAILTARLVYLNASFTGNLADGTGTGSFDTNWEITGVNSSYLDLLAGTIIGINFSGDTRLPNTLNPEKAWDGTTYNGADANGLPNFRVKTDSSVTFAAVPEPSTIFLLGAGLAGLGFVGIRRKKS